MQRSQLGTQLHSKPSAAGMAWFWTIALAATAIDIGAYLALERGDFGQTARTILALAPLPGNVILIVLVLSGIRMLDEFQKRVQLEAVALAFLASTVALFVYGYLQKAHLVGPLPGGLAWAGMWLLYGLGYATSVRHYR